MNEPAITINGIPLTTGQAMTVRVAIENFALDLSSNGLGDDDHGKAMTDAYLERIGEIRNCLYRSPASTRTTV